MQPTQPKERHLVLDVLRGFALVGVLFANMPHHSGFWMLPADAQESLPRAEVGHWLMWGLHFITDGKFYSIFSLLFGIGFALQLQKSMDQNEAFTGRFSRRLLLLFLFGLIHAVFFFVGDILTVYALMGFVLLFYRKASDASLLRWSLVLLAIPVLQYALMWWTQQGATTIEAEPDDDFFAQIIIAYQSGTIGEIMMNNIGGLIFGRYPDLVFTGRFFKVLAMFLLGFYVARKQYFVSIEQHKPFLKKVLIWSAVIGIPCNLVLAQLMTTNVYYSFEKIGILQPLVYAYGVPALGIFFACGIALALLYQKEAFKNTLSIFAPFGRMALTNYIMQSVICSFIYNSYGLALFATDGPLAFTLVGLGILIFQLIFSHFWLSRYQYGPLEWVWRVGTYRKWQPIKKDRLKTA